MARDHDPICDMPISHNGPCEHRTAIQGEGVILLHRGESEFGIRDLATVDRYYARDDLYEAGLRP